MSRGSVRATIPGEARLAAFLFLALSAFVLLGTWFGGPVSRPAWIVTAAALALLAAGWGLLLMPDVRRHYRRP